MTRVVEYDKITLGKRQRSVIAPRPLHELEQSIRTKALLHPPVVSPQDDGTYSLVVGERRYRAIGNIGKEGMLFSCDGRIVVPGECPVVFVTDLTPLQLFELEFDENDNREPLTWQERSIALAEIHRLRGKENPKQTKADTAREIVGSTNITSEKHLANVISEALIISEHLSDPTIAKARNAKDAYALVLKREEEKHLSILAERNIGKAKVAPNVTIRQGSCLDILPELEEATVDLIIADPPYGIAAGAGGFRGRTVHHHNYADDAATARDVAAAILTEGFRICKPRANLFMFCDIDLFPWLKEQCQRIGWTPFRTPITWQKSETEGLAPWGSAGPRRTCEWILFATKGQKGLIASPVDVLTVKRVARNERTHAAEKPVGLLQALIECSTLPGEFVLDPCCGSGSTLVAAKILSRPALGIEKDSTYYETAMANVHRGFMEEREPDNEH